MNILMMISKNDRYGAQRLFLDQVAALRALGHRVVVVGRGSEGYVSESARAMGVEYVGIPMKGINDIFSLSRLVKKNNINVIHSFLDRADYFGIIVSWFTRKPLVSTMNVPRYHIGYRLADRVVTVSKKQKELLVAKGIPTKKGWVIRPGIEVSRFLNPDTKKREIWRRRLNSEQYSMVFCHVSSLIPRKGHLLSLEIVSECKKKGEIPLLIIAGDPLCGEYYDSLINKISELGLEKNVYFTGWTSELPEILSLSQFTLLPSHDEAFGIVLIEGMASGTPIIVKAEEGGAVLIEEHGVGFLYREDKGVASVASDIMALWRKPDEYKKLSVKCQTIARNYYSYESFGGQLMKLYQSLPGIQIG